MGSYHTVLHPEALPPLNRTIPLTQHASLAIGMRHSPSVNDKKVGMNRQEPRESWLRQHASAIILFTVFAVGVVLLVLGSIAQAPSNRFWAAVSTVLWQLGGACVAAVAVSTILSVRDIRDYLARSVYGGFFVNMMTRESRRELKKNLLLAELPNTVGEIEQDLCQDLEATALAALQSCHLHDYACTVTLSDRPDDLIEETSVVSYTVRTAHLRNETGEFECAFSLLIEDPHRMGPGEILKRFEARIGPETFGRDDIVVTKETRGSYDIIEFLFRRKITVQTEAAVTLTMGVVYPSSRSPVEIIYARYPTRGFRASLHYGPEYSYDAAWFRPWNGSTEEAMGAVNAELFQGGISVHRNDWQLPGCGVVLSWEESK